MQVITVGIPVFNAENYIKESIQSVLNQTFRDFELIIINDGSTDNSMKIIESIKDDRIMIINDGLNKGLPSRLNEISDMAKGRYIARMDADDIMHKQRLEMQLDCLKQNTEIDVLGTNAYSIDEFDNVKGIKMEFNLNGDNNLIFHVSAFIHPTIMGKKEWFKANPYDSKAIRIEDAELWSRSYSNSKFAVLKTPLLYYREFGGKYYKKYFKSLSGHLYVTSKLYSKSFYKGIVYLKKFFVPNLLKGIIYFIFSFINLEQVLIQKRIVPISKDQLLKAVLDLDDILDRKK